MDLGDPVGDDFLVGPEQTAVDEDAVEDVGLLVGEHFFHLADLLTLGCYGHSRLRETVFGGTTTRILREMKLPVLMAH